MLTVLVASLCAAQPAHLPLLGDAGRGADGYPKQYVDRVALRAMLRDGKFDDLTAALTEAQTEFETDTTLEYWPLDAADAVGTGELELRPRLDAWCKANPTSFAPWLARGTHHVRRAMVVRGTRYIKDTPASAIKAMKAELALAVTDLEKALKLKSESIDAVRMLILVRRLLGEDPSSLIRTVFQKCPDCFQVRVNVMNSLAPRWGGSYELMESFAKSSAERDNPRMKVLPGLVLLDKYEMGLLGDEALRRALELGEYWYFYVELAKSQSQFDPRSARAAADRAAELRPMAPEVVDVQLLAAARMGAWEEAGRLWSLAHQLDPTLDSLKLTHDALARQLPAIARAREREGSPKLALTLYDVVVELSPKDATLRAERDALRTSLDAGR
ncbi:MAG: DUF4034 domain-containing protein [Myxococcaceae bacterium]